jgi:cell wall assembly regulator SMI1
MEQLLARLDKWLKTNRADFVETLGAPATSAQLDDLEYRIDSKLPQSFRDFYQWHNGQLEGFGFFASYSLMPVDFVIDAWEGEFARLSDVATDGREFVASDPHWVPFLHSGGSFICLDLTGVHDGKPGQVIDDEKPNHYFILAPTLEQWLECYVTSLELGYWVPDEEGTEYYPKELEGEKGTHYGKLLSQRLPGFPITVDRRR